jgi:predicted amidohydrolase
MLQYRAVALQLRCYPVNFAAGSAEARQLIAGNIARLGRVLPGMKVAAGDDVRLVVLPEYVFTGFPLGTSTGEWASRAALDPNGPEYEILARLASDNDVYLCGNAYETDAHFPGIFFQACFVFDPAGSRVLRYRRLTSMFAPTPHDYWDRYLEIYGEESIFPVARTPIGNLAVIASEEIQYPELVRCFALRGAEVLCHPSSEPLMTGLTPKDVAKRARAIENLAYVVSANTAGIENIPFLEETCDGLSKFIDFQGRVLVEAGPGESAAAAADINITALRRYRNRPDMNNFLSRMRMELFAETYGRKGFYPANNLEGVTPEREHFKTTQREVIARLRELGVIEPEA